MEFRKNQRAFFLLTLWTISVAALTVFLRQSGYLSSISQSELGRNHAKASWDLQKRDYMFDIGHDRKHQQPRPVTRPRKISNNRKAGSSNEEPDSTVLERNDKFIRKVENSQEDQEPGLKSLKRKDTIDIEADPAEDDNKSKNKEEEPGTRFLKSRRKGTGSWEGDRHEDTLDDEDEESAPVFLKRKGIASREDDPDDNSNESGGQDVEDKKHFEGGNRPSETISKFRKRFLLWEEANATLTSSIGPDLVNYPEKYFIFRCDGVKMDNCGGWADRVKGALVSYVIANLTGRRFKVEMPTPQCNLLHYVSPNLVDWSLPAAIHHDLRYADNRSVEVIRKISKPMFHDTIHKINFTEMLDEKLKFIYFSANLDYGDGLRKSTVYRRQLAWMKDLTNDQIMSTLYTRVFRLAPHMKLKMDAFMKRVHPTKRHRLICAHVRMGVNPTLPFEKVLRYEKKDLYPVWQFLTKHSRSDTDKIFLMTDSEDVVNASRSQSFSSKIVETTGPINHIMKSKYMGQDESCAGMEKVIFDQHVLMQCDVLLVSKSGLSRMSAYVRGTDEGLYCLFMGGKIIPCKPMDIKQLYDIRG